MKDVQMPVDLPSAVKQISDDIDAGFDQILSIPTDARAQLYEAMRYSAIGGGKRLRPLLLTATANIFNVERHIAVHASMAVEAMHVYSLIHDDLPCMDDDDLRRGKPTAHLKYGEATAILAGDALLALAFEILSDKSVHADPFVRSELVATLAKASGPAGMAGGQMMDLEAEKTSFELETITRLQHLKTGALIDASVEMGAILGHVTPEERTHLRGYSSNIGLAFQIADDIMDIEGDPTLAGKALQKDTAAGKETFVSLMGLDRAKEQARHLVEQAIEHLNSYGKEADLLRAIARYIVERDR